MMVPFDDLISVIQEDNELKNYELSSSDTLSTLYSDFLPMFEKFLFNLSDDTDVEKLTLLLRTYPVRFRVLYTYRFNQFIERIQNGYQLPTYKNLKDILIVELYENNNDKINYY